VTRVLIAAQSAVVRAGLASLITASPMLTLVGSAPGLASTDFAQQIDDLHPEVVLVELSLHDEDILSELLAVEVRGSVGMPAFVAMTDDLRAAWAVEALRSGIRAILPREVTTDELVAAVRAAAEGLVILRPETMETLLTGTTARRDLSAPEQEPLTPREKEVLGMMAEGLGNKTIAFRLDISEHTVKFHIGSIFAKLRASSRTEAVTLGIRRGLIML
jgi:NarL family two-component system response regulator YdfI